jgi:hypothetical protein
VVQSVGDIKAHSRKSPLTPRRYRQMRTRLPPRYSADNKPVKGFLCARSHLTEDAGPRQAGANTLRRRGAQALIAAVWLVSSAAPAGGARSARARDTARAARIARMASGSSTVAIKRRRPPHRGQASTSISNARLIRSAHAPVPGFRCRRRVVTRFGRLAGRGARLDQRCAVGNHARSPAGMRREHAVVEHEVDPRPRGERGELFEQLQWLEHEMARPVTALSWSAHCTPSVTT